MNYWLHYKNKPKKIHFSKLIFLIYRDMDTLHLMLSPPPTMLPPLTKSPSTATTVMDMTTPPPAMGRDTEHPPRLLETVSGTVTVTHMVTAAINTWIRGDWWYSEAVCSSLVLVILLDNFKKLYYNIFIFLFINDCLQFICNYMYLFLYLSKAYFTSTFFNPHFPNFPTNFSELMWLAGCKLTPFCLNVSQNLHFSYFDTFGINIDILYL